MDCKTDQVHTAWRLQTWQVHKVWTGEATNGHCCSASAADPDERRTGGPHSSAEEGASRLLESNRHTPCRSNLAPSLQAATRRKRSVEVHSRYLRLMGGVPCSRGHRKAFAAMQHRPAQPGILGRDGHNGQPSPADPPSAAAPHANGGRLQCKHDAELREQTTDAVDTGRALFDEAPGAPGAGKAGLAAQRF